MLFGRHYEKYLKYYHYTVIVSTTYLLFYLYSTADFHHLQKIDWTNLHLRDFYPIINQEKIDKTCNQIFYVMMIQTFVLYTNPGFKNIHWNVFFKNVVQMLFLYVFKHSQTMIQMSSLYYMFDILDYLYYVKHYIPNLLTQMMYFICLYIYEFFRAFYIFLCFKESLMLIQKKNEEFTNDNLEYFTLFFILSYMMASYLIDVIPLFFIHKK